MCGISGYSISDKSNSDYASLLKSSINRLKHRGPDNIGFWINSNNSLGMAHSRLSIIDLNDKANQPMASEDGTIIIGFNGEIYNFIELRQELEGLGCVFCTHSDTEVILHGFKVWNKKIFSKLRGMFAISIFDVSQNEIILARDHSGQKPLFYRVDKNKKNFIFSSELKGLIEFEDFSRTISKNGLTELFYKGYCGNTNTIYKNAQKLGAGNYLIFNFKKNKINIKEFWSLTNAISMKNFIRSSEAQLVEKLESILLESIDLQFRADVPIGLLLSGGVDSSLIVALASKIKNNLNTYTVRFSGHQKYDESQHARLIAEHFHTNHLELEASNIEPTIFDDIVHYYDEPIFDTSIVPTFMVSKIIAQHCKVAIGGDGGDELFGGYPHYDKLLKIKNSSKYFPYFLRKKISNYAQDFLPIGLRGKKTLEFYGTDMMNNYPNTAEFFSCKEQKKLFNIYPNNFFDINFANLKKPQILDDFIKTATFEDFHNFLREDILVKVDRASMANSLEIRSPFLDHKLIEFAFIDLPSELKVDTNRRKILLKKLAHRHLPQSFDMKRKQGFSLPLKDLMMSANWKEYFYSKIQESDPAIFNHNYAFGLLDKQQRYYNNAERMAGLLFFMIWVKKFNPSFS